MDGSDFRHLQYFPCHLILSPVDFVQMKAKKSAAGKPRFEKVGECLYRYSSTGVYYALIKYHGKQKRQSLKTTDKPLAKRKLAELKNGLSSLNPSAGRVRLRELCEKYLTTVASQKPKTIRRKRDIINRLLTDLSDGPNCAISSIKQSSLMSWLASYRFEYASYNLYLQCIKALFALAVDDGDLIKSPAAAINGKKTPRSLKRLSPSFEEFQRIVSDVRRQPYNSDAAASADFLEFMGLAGLGQAELAALRRSDIDFEREEMSILRVKTGEAFVVPIYPQLQPLLKNMRVLDMPHDQRVFAISDAKRALAASCRRLQLPTYSQRSFRRMFITRCIELGIDVKVIADWQGHTDGGQLILKTYSQVRKPHADAMAKKLTIPSINPA